MEKNFIRHLEAMLPLRNPSGDRWQAVQEYALRALSKMGRNPEVDSYGNILSIVSDEPAGIVAHTDSVGQERGQEMEPFTLQNGVYTSRNFKRPIGGDDKVGVAIALALAQELPTLSVILPADEEIGCQGSSVLKLPYHRLLVQCDRRGATDLVNRIGWEVVMTSAEFDEWAIYLLPHRELAEGMMTDVEYLSAYAGNAVNLSCGYFNPHSVEECIVTRYAVQTLHDAYTLLTEIPVGIQPREEQDPRESWWYDEEEKSFDHDDEYWLRFLRRESGEGADDPFDRYSDNLAFTVTKPR